MSPRENEIKRKIAYFKNPKLYQPMDILDNPDLVPKSKGVYGWYFNVLPPHVPQNDYVNINGWVLLYIGIAGKSETSKSTLQRRIIRNHLKGRASVSTLRRTLGSLLLDDLNLQPQKYGTVDNKKFWFGKEGEELLSAWMIDHARITWLEDDRPRGIEKLILTASRYKLPLNIESNLKSDNPFNITDLRSQCLKKAWRP